MSPWHIDTLDLTLRLLMSLAFGGLIGFERELSNSAAGLRTHILVCVGSTLIMLISIYGFSEFANEYNVRMDPSRLAAQVVSGIGFLGAGTILITGNVIKGLTTAASVWVVAAIGLAIGAGFIYPAAVASVLVLISLWVLNKVEKRFISTRKRQMLKIEVEDRPGLLSQFSELIAKNKGSIRKMTVDTDHSGKIILYYTLMLSNGKVPALIEQITQVEGVQRVTVDE